MLFSVIIDLSKGEEMTVGSICSGIESATVALAPLGYKFKWYSEIAPFPCEVLKQRHTAPNIGNMLDIKAKILKGEVESTDMIVGGTPCQAFSFAGLKRGLEDERGNLALTFCDIVKANDEVRTQKGLDRTLVLWENVEGVLSDKTNAFGCFISALAELPYVIEQKKYSTFGVIKGVNRKVAWRVLDAKYFGLPQQRKRVYVLSSDINFPLENVLFERGKHEEMLYTGKSETFEKDGVSYKVFRDYTDCLYASYGTKWNGNAGAKNGSLFVVQNGKLRRFSPLECERLMGFPDGYTNIKGASKTSRYKSLGNAWAVPVIQWLGKRFLEPAIEECDISNCNCSLQSNNPVFGNIKDIVVYTDDDKLFLTDKGKDGIKRRYYDYINKELLAYLV